MYDEDRKDERAVEGERVAKRKRVTKGKAVGADVAAQEANGVAEPADASAANCCNQAPDAREIQGKVDDEAKEQADGSVVTPADVDYNIETDENYKPRHSKSEQQRLEAIDRIKSGEVNDEEVEPEIEGYTDEGDDLDGVYGRSTPDMREAFEKKEKAEKPAAKKAKAAKPKVSKAKADKPAVKKPEVKEETDGSEVVQKQPEVSRDEYPSVSYDDFGWDE